MESNEETEASIVSLLLVKNKKTRNRSVRVNLVWRGALIKACMGH